MTPQPASKTPILFLAIRPPFQIRNNYRILASIIGVIRGLFVSFFSIMESGNFKQL
jgi:hypothetical protein